MSGFDGYPPPQIIPAASLIHVSTLNYVLPANPMLLKLLKPFHTSMYPLTNNLKKLYTLKGKKRIFLKHQLKLYCRPFATPFW